MLSKLCHLIGYTAAVVNRNVCHVEKKDKIKLFHRNSLVQLKNIIENRFIIYNSI